MTARLFRMSASVARTVNATKVDYRNLGNSGLRVSYPILGGMSFGDSKWLDWVLNEDQALPVLKAAYDLGINTVSLDNFHTVYTTSPNAQQPLGEVMATTSLIAIIVGYGQCVLERRIRAHLRKSTTAVPDPAK